jgi:hypothetical protein
VQIKRASFSTFPEQRGTDFFSLSAVDIQIRDSTVSRIGRALGILAKKKHSVVIFADAASLRVA